jgi:AAA15 family ATPase/GTPase
MQIKISSLLVQNGGALKDVKIDFTDTTGQPQQVTVLGGANGSGKTTVLELIFALVELFKFSPTTDLTSIDNNIQAILKRTEYAELELLIDNEKCQVFSDKPRFPYSDANLHHDKHGIIWQEFYSNARIWHLQYSSKSKKMAEQIRLNQGKSLNFLDSPSESVPANTIPSILYFPHHRELQPVEGEQIYREDVKYQWCYRYLTGFDFQGSLESYLIWLDYADKPMFELVIDFLNQLNFEGKTFHINRKQLSVVVKTREGSEHPLIQLSSGEQNILILLLELRRRLLPGSIVLIDEIENSLHPEFQHRFAKNLARLQKQIPFQLILTTHQYAFVKIFGEPCTRLLTEF